MRITLLQLPQKTFHLTALCLAPLFSFLLISLHHHIVLIQDAGLTQAPGRGFTQNKNVSHYTQDCLTNKDI